MSDNHLRSDALAHSVWAPAARAAGGLPLGSWMDTKKGFHFICSSVFSLVLTQLLPGLDWAGGLLRLRGACKIKWRVRS